MLTTLGALSPLALLAIVLGYWVVAMMVFAATMLMRVLREAWSARRDRREPQFALFEPYPAYLLRFRRTFLLLLLGPPFLLVGAWLVVKIL